MITLSLCMIVKNEEDTLGRCLDSVRAAVDEMIVVDTGSDDDTVAVAVSKGAKVYSFTWCDDFAAARNFSFSKASCEYIMWLDADDVIRPEQLNILKKLKAELGEPVREIAARYEVAFDEAGRPTLIYYRERIFLRKAGFVWKGEVHEAIPLLPDALFSEFTVTHAKLHPTEKGRNLRIFEKLIREGKPLDARQKYYYARELFYNARYKESIAFFKDFLAGDGWKPDKIGASLLLARCYALTGEDRLSLEALLTGLQFGEPAAELCCAIGERFLIENDCRTAAFWYSLALGRNGDPQTGAFMYMDYSGYIPLIQLCVCYDRLGQYDTAEAYNEQAALVKPESHAVRMNREYFRRRRGGT